mgnify:CR=1 FL=1
MKALTVIPWFLLAIVLNGVALKVLWGWFVVEVFSLPALSIPNALGLSIIARLLTFQQSDHEEMGPKRAVHERVLTAILWPLLAMALGALYRWLA